MKYSYSLSCSNSPSLSSAKKNIYSANSISVYYTLQGQIYLHVIKHHWWFQNDPKKTSNSNVFRWRMVLESIHDGVKLVWERKFILDLLVTINGKTESIRKIYSCSHASLHLENESSTFLQSNENTRRNIIIYWSKALAKMWYKACILFINHFLPLYITASYAIFFACFGKIWLEY